MSAEEGYQLGVAALCLWREARSESNEAMLGVFWVIMNRMHDPKKRWPTTMAAVVLQPWQFSSFNHTDVNATLFPVATDVNFLRCCEVIDAPGISDPTIGATLYHSYHPGDPHWPAWATQDKFTTQIGAFRFYRS